MTKGEDKTKEQLMKELAEMRQRIAELETSETRHKQLEEMLRVQTDELQALIDGLSHTGIGVDIVSTDYKILFQNQTLEEKFKGLTGELCYEKYRGLKKPCDPCPMIKAVKSNKVENVELTDAEGRNYELFSAPLPNPDGTVDKAIEVVIDITERKQAEERVEHLNLVLRAIRTVNQLITQEKDRDRLLEGICDGLTQTRGYYTAWIALRDESGRFLTHAEAGLGEDFLPLLERIKRGELPDCARKGLAQAEVVVTKDPLSTCTGCPLTAKHRGGDVMTTRLEYGRKVYGLLSVSIPSVLTANEEERSLFTEVVTDIAFALHNIEMEEERKQAEEALRESEEKYRTLFEDSRDAVFITTRDGKLTSTNQAYLDLFGYTREEVIGLDVRKTYANPEDRLRYQQEMERKGEVKDFELKLRKKDGTELDCLLTATVRQPQDGVILGYQGIIRDITGRKLAEKTLRESEEKYRSLVGNVDVGICRVSPGDKGDFIEVNPAMSRILGYSREELLRMNVSETYQGPAERKKFADKVCAQGLVKNEELKLRRKDGAPIVVSNTSTAVRDEKENIIYIDAILEDITERKKAEAEKLELEQQAQVASRLATVGEMASGIAHEINNPLTAVIGYADLVLERDIPEEAKDDVRIIHNGAKRVADIVKRLLAFAHQYQPERTYLDINDIIKTTLELRAYELETSNIKATTNLAPDLPRTMADAGQLQQVFLNLIINAETEMRLAHGGGKLSVKTETVGSTIRISFKDDGPGIAKENLEKIFDPFFTTREVGKGTGLGLSLSHGIIAEHNGRIYAKSKPGKGATFIVELPVITEEKQLEMAEPAEEVKKVAPARILVVDDEPAICQFLKRVLTGEGHEVETVASAGDALERMKGTRYNLILLDIKLPGKSGIELYKRMQKIAESLARRVVFITGDVMGTDTRSFLSKTRVPYITKPFDTEQLKRDISRKLTEGAQGFKV